MSFMSCPRIIVKVDVKFEAKICVRPTVAKPWYAANNKSVLILQGHTLEVKVKGTLLISTAVVVEKIYKLQRITKQQKVCECMVHFCSCTMKPLHYQT